MHSHVLEEVDSAKYLGVTFHKSLSWNQHIDQAAMKANRARAFLNRNIMNCPQKTKELAYKALVRPIVEYASVVWDPYTADNIQKLEMVQRRAARLVMNDYRQTSSVSNMINHLQWQPLRERRAQSRAIMMYRRVHNLVDIPNPSTQLVPTLQIRGHSTRFLLPFARTNIYMHSFFPDAIRLWNGLPQHAVDAPSLDAFKGAMALSTPLRVHASSSF